MKDSTYRLVYAGLGLALVAVAAFAFAFSPSGTETSLPEPIDCEVTGTSSATQIVCRGPLPIALEAADVFLASSIHGETPYFTASLEAAIQAGAIAAARYDASVERLPMGRATRSPWSAAGRSRAHAPGAETDPLPGYSVPIPSDPSTSWRISASSSATTPAMAGSFARLRSS